MTSFGMGEILIIAILLLLSLDIKHIGKILKWSREMRSKFFRIQSDWKSQLDDMVAEEEAIEDMEKNISSKKGMRNWGKQRVQTLPAGKRFEASKNFLEKLSDIPEFQKAKVIGAYSSLYDELDTTYLLKQILDQERTLLLPYIQDDQMSFAAIKTLGQDTEPGTLGILEPKPEFRGLADTPEPDLLFVPGRCFDESGGRIGRGKAFYDKFMNKKNICTIGLCFDVQISPKKLNLEPHDKRMDYTLSELRLIDHRNQVKDNGKSK